MTKNFQIISYFPSFYISMQKTADLVTFTKEILNGQDLYLLRYNQTGHRFQAGK